MSSENQKIADLLRKVATVYILTGKNRFRIIAYQKAADAIEMLEDDIKRLYKTGKLNEIEGLGTTIAGHIDEYFKDKDGSYLTKIINEIPSVVFDLMKVEGIGPKKAFKLIQVLQLDKSEDIFSDIKSAALKNKIATIATFGEKSQSDIIRSIDIFLKNKDKPVRFLISEAKSTAEDIVFYLSQNKKVLKAIPMGSLRRRAPTVGDLDIAIVVKDKKDFTSVLDYFVKYPKIISIENKGDRKCAVIIIGGMRVDIRVSLSEDLGAMLQYFTGSKAHNIQLRELGQRKGLSLSEYGIKRAQNSKPPPAQNLRRAGKYQNYNSNLKTFKTEKEFYNFLGLQYIPPEMREGIGEIELALKHKIPDLVQIGDVKADLQIHSNYNLEPSHDLGQASVEEILKRADKLNYNYVAITDHNPSISNHSADQIVHILRTREKYFQSIMNKKNTRCKLFNSLEVDIRPDGQLSLPEQALKHLDFILISIHSSFNMPVSDMTDRILRALDNPKVKILAHPTARLLNKRDSISADWDKIFKKCKSKNIAIEINASPARLDLPDRLIREAQKYELVFSLGTDSHDLEGLDNMVYGVDTARRGWLSAKQIINTWNKEKLEKFLI